ncbi:UDP-3-O-(3-hydroxymyristoyl)glucosamine N-acyltransferase [soil metagenome]
MKFSQIVAALGDEVTASSLAAVSQSGEKAAEVEGDRQIEGLAAIQTASDSTLSYVEGGKFARFVETTEAGALILPGDPILQAQASDRGKAWVSVKNPRLAFARVIDLFYQPYRLPSGIHPSAVIDPTAKIGKDVGIGPHVVIQAQVEVGDRVCIHPNAVVYPGASIGAGTTLHANCVIHERTQIGANCVIHSCAVIGSEGFGFVPTAAGWEKMHQSGITVIEDGVEIGCNATVDRPAVGETRIGRNTKIDNMVHVAHGCQIGEAVVMAGQVGMAGGVTIGDRAILAGQVGIANQAHIGKGAILHAQAGIYGDVPPGEAVSGSPALPHQLFLRSALLMKRLPEMAKAIKQLQRQLGQD